MHTYENGGLMDKGWQHNYNNGRKAFEEKNFEAALVCLEKVAGEKSGFADVYNMLGLVYYNFSRVQEAVDAFLKAIEINPNYTEAILNLAVIYNEMGQFEKSSVLYAKARETRKEPSSYLDPYVKGKLANMHASIGHIYKDLGMYKEAAGEYRRCLELRPDFVDIKTELGVVYRDLKDYSSSVRELADAVAINPGYVAPRVQLGLTYYTMGQHDKAKAEWQAVLEKHPEHKMARMYMGLFNRAV